MNTLSDRVQWGKGFMLGAFLGSALGTVLALLCAPASGKDVRLTMREKTKSLLSETGEFIERTKDRASTSLHHAKRKLAGQQSRIAGALDAGVHAYRKEKEAYPEAERQ
jgi:gas vesicle protein